MKPIFGIKIMTARKWDRNRDYVARLLNEHARLVNDVNSANHHRNQLIEELNEAGTYIEQLRAEVDGQKDCIRKLSKLVTHLENQLERAFFRDWT